MTLNLADVLRADPVTSARTAIVTAVSGRVLTCNLDGGELEVTAARGYAKPASGDVALLMSTAAGSWYALDAIGRTTDPGPPPPPTEPANGTTTFAALETATYLGGARDARRADVAQSPDTTGAWAYGTIPPGTLEGANITSGSIWIHRTLTGIPGPADIYAWPHTAPTLGETTPAAAAPPQVIATLAPGQATWAPLPTAWLPPFAATPHGVAIGADPAAPALSAASLTTDPQSGALALDWIKET